MVIKNSEKFEKVVTKVFARLLETFPESVHLDASAAGYAIVGGQQVSTVGEFGELVDVKPSADELFFAHCVRWLGREQYLHFYQDHHTSFSGVVLTEKGLATLNATPPCLRNEFYN